MYFIVFEFLGLIPNIPMQIQINIADVVGDMRPFKTVPKTSGFFKYIFSRSQENLNQKSSNMKKQ
jgi:hypothetical protein